MRRRQPMQHHRPARRRRLDFEPAAWDEEEAREMADRHHASGQVSGRIPTLIPHHTDRRDMRLIDARQALRIARDPTTLPQTRELAYQAAEYRRHQAAQHQRRIDDINAGMGRRRKALDQ